MIRSDLVYIVASLVVVGLVFLVGVLFGRSRARPEGVKIVFQPVPTAQAASEPAAGWWTLKSFAGDVAMSDETYLGRLSILSALILSVEWHERARA